MTFFLRWHGKIRHPVGVDPLHGLAPKVVIAAANPNRLSPFRRYVNAIEPLARIFDGYLLLSSRGRQIRTDLSVPVWKISAGTTLRRMKPLRQPDTRLSAWEVAGTSPPRSTSAGGTRATRTARSSAPRPGCSGNAVRQSDAGATRTPTSDVLGAPLSSTSDGGSPSVWRRRQAPKIEITSLGVPVLNQPQDLRKHLRSWRVMRSGLAGAESGSRRSRGSDRPQRRHEQWARRLCQWGYYVPFDVAKLTALYPDHARYVARRATAITNTNLPQRLHSSSGCTTSHQRCGR